MDRSTTIWVTIIAAAAAVVTVVGVAFVVTTHAVKLPSLSPVEACSPSSCLNPASPLTGALLVAGPKFGETKDGEHSHGVYPPAAFEKPNRSQLRSVIWAQSCRERW